MFERLHSSPRRDLHPSLDSLEERPCSAPGCRITFTKCAFSVGNVVAATHDSDGAAAGAAASRS